MDLDGRNGVGDGLPSPGRRITVGRLDETTGYRVLRPQGRPEWMFTLTLGGAGRFRVAGTEVLARRADLVVVPPNVPHDYAVQDQSRRWEFLWAHAVVRAEWHPLLDRIATRPHGVPLPESHLQEVERAFSEALAHRRTSRPVADRLAMNCLERALLLAADARDAPRGLDPGVARVLEHIDAHLDGDLSTPTLARVAGLSASRVAHVFTAQIGTSVQRHVEGRRMDLAVQLLDVSDRPVSWIARRCGFEDPLYFSRRFRRAHGLSPTTYRNSLVTGSGARAGQVLSNGASTR